MTGLAESEPEHSISALVARGLSTLNALLIGLSDSASPAERSTAASHRARLKLWAGNLGAHRPSGTHSLEYRLRDAPSIRNHIIALLRDLCNSADEGLACLSIEHNSHSDTGTIDSIDLELEEYFQDESGQDDSEMASILDDIGHTIDCLLRLSIVIRNPAPQAKFKSRIAFVEGIEQWDTNHVREKFPAANANISARLGRAIAWRRQYFKYREEHCARVARGLEPEDDADQENGSTVERSTTVASSISNRFKGQFVNSSDLVDDSKSDTSLTSYTPSTADETQMRVPPLPEESKEGPFECPFCRMIVLIETRQEWKTHVFRDLEPYVCISEDCKTPEKHYSRRGDWMSHVKQEHWRTWHCPLGCSVQSMTAEQFREHITEIHKDHPAARNIDSLQELCGQVDLRRAEGPCPLCSECLITSAHHYSSHIAVHLESLALFALPDLDTRESRGQKEVGEEQEAGERPLATDKRSLTTDEQGGASVFQHGLLAVAVARHSGGVSSGSAPKSHPCSDAEEEKPKDGKGPATDRTEQEETRQDKRKPTVTAKLFGDCQTCKKPVPDGDDGFQVQSADKRLAGSYHKACFRCKGCNKPLDRIDYVVDGRPYCKKDYDSAVAMVDSKNMTSPPRSEQMVKTERFLLAHVSQELEGLDEELQVEVERPEVIAKTKANLQSTAPHDIHSDSGYGTIFAGVETIAKKPGSPKPNRELSMVRKLEEALDKARETLNRQRVPPGAAKITGEAAKKTREDVRKTQEGAKKTEEAMEKEAIEKTKEAFKKASSKPSRRERELSYYGVNPSSDRTRPGPQRLPPRPSSYYGPPSRPPPANARFYAQQSAGGPASHLGAQPLARPRPRRAHDMRKMMEEVFTTLSIHLGCLRAPVFKSRSITLDSMEEVLSHHSQQHHPPLGLAPHHEQTQRHPSKALSPINEQMVGDCTMELALLLQLPLPARNHNSVLGDRSAITGVRGRRLPLPLHWIRIFLLAHRHRSHTSLGITFLGLLKTDYPRLDHNHPSGSGLHAL
ncbi:hypothetical protein QBC34DRAFT_374207 [Podospora aff. communis PSN243]|uniref:LIM zinc-binding domain-containing protein n=1 Tax=Podospora aff. communis PSN243 TaxID=3040156 RepID=A0AAV9H7C4_9PEZI|nr:hypothetical protein QBC34DRAFT_374207 [Podospora aff. communis PSN243]